MWKYIRQYLFFAIIAGLFMMGEVLMDLIQPGIMSQIVDDGVLGVHSAGAPNLQRFSSTGKPKSGGIPFSTICQGHIGGTA